MPELDELIRSNPKAGKQEASIRAALEALKDLQDYGIAPTGYELASAFGTATSRATVGGKEPSRMRFCR